MADINLIQQEVKQEQAKQQVVKSTTTFSIILLVLMVLISGFFFFRNFNTKNQISEMDSSITKLRADINTMSDVEIVARNLDAKYSTIKDIMATRDYYDILMSEFKARIPNNVSIDTFGTGRANTINVSGTGSDYIAIAKFVQNLSNKNFEGAKSGLEELFTDVTLNSVNLDAQTSDARFFVVVTINPGLIKR